MRKALTFIPAGIGLLIVWLIGILYALGLPCLLIFGVIYGVPNLYLWALLFFFSPLLLAILGLGVIAIVRGLWRLVVAR